MMIFGKFLLAIDLFIYIKKISINYNYIVMYLISFK